MILFYFIIAVLIYYINIFINKNFLFEFLFNNLKLFIYVYIINAFTELIIIKDYLKLSLKILKNLRLGYIIKLN